MSEEMNPPPLTPREREVENALIAFRPAPTQMNRDTLMYAAGMAAGNRAASRALLPWKIAAAFLVCTSTALALWRPERIAPEDHPTVARHVAPSTPIAVAQPSIPAVPIFLPEGDSYLQTRQRVLVLGLNALPSLPDSAPSPPSSPSPPQHLRYDILDAAPAWQRRAASTGDHS